MDEVIEDQVLVGYIGKQDYDFNHFDWRDHTVLMPTIWKTRGKKNDWIPEDWPPVKVRITIEVMK